MTPRRSIPRLARRLAALLLLALVITTAVAWAACLAMTLSDSHVSFFIRGSEAWQIASDEQFGTGYASAGQVPLSTLDVKPSEWLPDAGGFQRYFESPPISPARLVRLTKIINEASSPRVVLICDSGWPFRALWGAEVSPTGRPGTAKSFGTIPVPTPNPWIVPIRPIWLGLLADTAIYALVIGLAVQLALAIRHQRRRRRGHCPACAYDLGHNLPSGCPECGWNRSTTPAPDHQPCV